MILYVVIPERVPNEAHTPAAYFALASSSLQALEQYLAHAPGRSDRLYTVHELAHGTRYYAAGSDPGAISPAA